jgi:hypothetical protein
MEGVPARVGIALTTGATFERPVVPAGIGEILNQDLKEPGVSRTLCRIGGAEHEPCVRSPEGTHQRRRIFDYPSSDEVFQQRKPGVIQRDVGRGLGTSSRGSECAGQSRRKEERAHRCRHCGET